MRLLRNVFRRKLRAFLTIFGISIGVLALVVMGALAEKLTLLVDGGTRYYAGKVTVVASGGFSGLGAAPLHSRLLPQIEGVDGVERVSANISTLLEEDPSSVNFGTMPVIVAEDGRAKGYEEFVVNIAKGRELTNEDNGKIVLGSDLAKRYKAKVGGSVEIRGKDYEVVGIWEKTLTAPDTSAAMTMSDAQEIVASELPGVVGEVVDPATIVTTFVVYPEEGEDPEVIAARIEEVLDDVDAVSPTDFEKQVKEPLAIFTSIIYAIALISLLVGGLSVINTMTMSVAERTREIGVRKAIGASNGQIMRQFIAESGIIGLIGGLVGLGLGYLITILGNAAGEASGTVLFLMTARLAVGSVVFAIVLGVVSGLYPAWHAARLRPVEALRYE